MNVPFRIIVVSVELDSRSIVTQIEKVACTSIVVYEILVTLGREIDLVWR